MQHIRLQVSPGGKNIQHLYTRNLRIAKGIGPNPGTVETGMGAFWSMSEGPGESSVVYKLYQAWKVFILNSKW